MTITAITLEELLKDCRKIKIPFYQRGYSWDKENVEKLLEDIYSSKTNNYFLGSIILKNNGNSKIIIDGQQRISTILLIYKIIQKYYDKNSSEIKIDNWYNEIKFDSANLIDGKYLSEIIENEEKDFGPETIKTKYYENYMIINDFIKNKPINNFYNQLEKVLLSQVFIDTNADEHVIFSQINSTGKVLSGFDLVKNYLFSHISDDLQNISTSNKEKEITKTLNKLASVSEKLKSKDDVVRHFIGFKTFKLPNKNSKNIYKTFVELHKNDYQKNSQLLFKDLYEFFFYYNYLEKKRWDKKLSNSLNTLMESISTYAILIITFFSENSQIKNGVLEMTSDQLLVIKNSLLILEFYKFKREFCGISEKTITRFIPTISRDIRRKEFDNFKTDIVLYFFLVHENSIDSLVKKMSRMPSDSEFKKGINETHVYKKTANLFLYRISTFYNPKDHTPSTELTIEHIIPQELEKWIKDGYKEDLELVASKIHTIGNLTLTAHNSGLSNKIFKFKKEYFSKNDNFPLNKYFNNPDNDIKEWNTKEIEIRANELFKNCQDIWYFDNYKNIISENQVFNSFRESPENTENQEMLDFIAKNSVRFDGNKSHFKPIKDLINYHNIENLLKNLMVYGMSTENNEKEVFGVKKNGWVSQSIYNFLDLSSSRVKGKYDENQFNYFIKSNTKNIVWLVDYIKEELS